MQGMCSFVVVVVMQQNFCKDIEQCLALCQGKVDEGNGGGKWRRQRMAAMAALFADGDIHGNKKFSLGRQAGRANNEFHAYNGNTACQVSSESKGGREKDREREGE